MSEIIEIENSIENAPQVATPDALANFTPFHRLAEMTLKTVAESSARVYSVTFRQWNAWCDETGVNPVNLHPNNVTEFIDAQGGTITTRKNKMASLRKLAEICAILDGDIAKVNYELLKRTRPPKPSATEQTENERAGRALSPAECNRLLEVNAFGTDAKSRRNMAIVATLLFTGLRRSELSALMWSDIDLSAGVIRVRHGKGDKNRHVSIVDSLAIDALKAWRSVSRAESERRVYVFCGLTKSGVSDDNAVTDKTVERVVSATAESAGIGAVLPHDLRRTFATEWLNAGGVLANLQAQLGHENAGTTLEYAKASDAQTRRENVRFRFGGVKIAKPQF